MKKILITGSNSYIGTSFESYLKKKSPGKYQIKTVDMTDSSWKSTDFSEYDVVYHVAGIVHRKETPDNAHIYYEVNRDLTIKAAEKAKSEGVRQFIFLSTMSVFGKLTGTVTKKTVPSPKTNYGKSKLQAEEALNKLRDSSFKVVIMRPPMVYGEGCKGNYNSVISIVSKFPFFPKVFNKRSVIDIENLSSFVEMAIDNELSGLYFPQNKEYVNTSRMACDIAVTLNKKVYMSYFLGFIALALIPFCDIAKKAFGTLIYKDTEDFDFRYCVK